MKIYDFDVRYYSSLDAVVFTDKVGNMFNCNKEDEMIILRNILCGEIRSLRSRNAELESRLERIEDIIDEKYNGDY